MNMFKSKRVSWTCTEQQRPPFQALLVAQVRNDVFLLVSPIRSCCSLCLTTKCGRLSFILVSFFASLVSINSWRWKQLQLESVAGFLASENFFLDFSHTFYLRKIECLFWSTFMCNLEGRKRETWTQESGQVKKTLSLCERRSLKTSRFHQTSIHVYLLNDICRSKNTI